MDQQTTEHPFETGLDRHPANFVPLSPVSFLRRSVESFRDKTAVIDGERRITYGELHERCVRLASALAARGLGRLDAGTIAFSLNHGRAKVLLVDREFAKLIAIARPALDHEVLVIDIENPGLPDAPAIGDITYENLLAGSDPQFKWREPDDE